MILAHTLGSGGPEIEMLLIAAALLVLGIVFFVQRSAKTSISVVLIVAAFAIGVGSFALGGDDDASVGASDATVSITAPADGATVPAGEPFQLEVGVEGAELTGDTQTDDPRAAHLHVFVDGDLLAMPGEPIFDVELEPGEHTVTVELTTAGHASFDPRVLDEIVVTAE